MSGMFQPGSEYPKVRLYNQHIDTTANCLGVNGGSAMGASVDIPA